VELTPLGEKKGLAVTLQATNPRDLINTPIIRTQYVNLRYENLTITPVFDFEAGSFSYYDARTNTLFLGDGEQSLFHLNILEENAELENLQVFWQSVNGSAVDNSETKNGGHITLAREGGTSDAGEPLWRIGHNRDHLSATKFYLISKDLYYSAYGQRYSYPSSSNAYNPSVNEFENTTYSAARGQGITKWWVDVH
jgi:hypothetical protein